MPTGSTHSVAPDPAIKHVSDTAFWVASFRAFAGQRSDSAFSDPFAALLSGDRGRAIARSMSCTAMVEWSVIIRTSAIDRPVTEALAAGVDTVLNLGAGLDSRPYRMSLPALLRWVELDFPTIVDFKNAKLIEQQPICALERVGIDLRDRAARNRIIGLYAATSRNMLVITEGLRIGSVSLSATDGGRLIRSRASWNRGGSIDPIRSTFLTVYCFARFQRQCAKRY